MRRGMAVPTMVWSSAASNMPSITLGDDEDELGPAHGGACKPPSTISTNAVAICSGV